VVTIVMNIRVVSRESAIVPMAIGVTTISILQMNDASCGKVQCESCNLLSFLL
jgi:hypothetical protein